VRVNSFKEGKHVGPGGPGAEKPPMVNIIAPEFNMNSTKTCEVTPDGPNEFEFAVKAK
jgi:hypothetical protein